MTCTHAKGILCDYMGFSDAIPTKIVVDVKGYKPTTGTITFVENKYTNELYSDTLTIISNRDGANKIEEA